MQHSHFHRGVILASVIALGISGRSWGGERPLAVKQPADSGLSIAKFYTAPLVNVGEFSGMLVRLSCDSNGSEQTRRDYALVLQGDDVVHPLLPGTDEVRRELSSARLQGTEIAVHGKYYPNTGVIFVSRIAVTSQRSTAGDAPTLARCARD